MYLLTKLQFSYYFIYHKQQQNQKDTIKLINQLCWKWNPFKETDQFHTSQANRWR